MNDTLSEAPLSDKHPHLVVLQRSGQYLRRRGRPLIDQNSDWQIGEVVPSRQIGVGSGPIGDVEDRPLIDELPRYGRCLLEKAPGIIPKVED